MGLPIGDEKHPVFIDANGIPQVCTGSQSGSSAFVRPDIQVLETEEYKFPESWTPNQYREYTVVNDCILFYQIQIKSNGLIVNDDRKFSITAIIGGSVEIPVDSLNIVSNGSDMIVGSIACKAGTKIRLQNKSSVTIPASTASEKSFYILRECGPLESSASFDGLICSDCEISREYTYEFPEAWSANQYKDYTVSNDCMLMYQFQIKSNGLIVNDNLKFVLSFVIDGVEIPIDSVNIVSTGDDVRTGSILCKSGTKIRVRNASSSTIPASTASEKSFYKFKEITNKESV